MRFSLLLPKPTFPFCVSPACSAVLTALGFVANDELQHIAEFKDMTKFMTDELPNFQQSCCRETQMTHPLSTPRLSCTQLLTTTHSQLTTL